MSNIQKQIETLKAEILRLEEEQQRAEQEKRALDSASEQINSVLTETGISLETYIGYNLKKISRIVHKLEASQATKAASPTKKPSKARTPTRRRQKSSRPTITVKIPAGQYSKLPSQPEHVFEVKEKGPRPKLLKAYAEEVGLEAFLDQCRIG
jgi:hypothetical protein